MRRYSEEEKAAAVRMGPCAGRRAGDLPGDVKRVADQLGYGPESVRMWVKQADIDAGDVVGGEHRRVRARQGPGARGTRATPRERDIEAGRVFLRGGARPPVQEIVAFIDDNREDVVEGRKLGVEPIVAALRKAGVQIAIEHLLRRQVPPAVGQSGARR